MSIKIYSQNRKNDLSLRETLSDNLERKTEEWKRL